MSKRKFPRTMKSLTVNKLWKILGKMVAAGAGRRKVCVSKGTFTHNLESDGCTILNAHDCRLETINVADDDGGTAMNKDGSERYMTVAILFGDADDPAKDSRSP